VAACRISAEFFGVVVTARVAFSKRSWPYLEALVVPWLLCQGQRCVTRLRALAGHRRSLSSYYRFLAEGKFRWQVLCRCLFELIEKTFRPERLLIVVDDTLCPKWGRRIFGTAPFFDHVARPRPGFLWGHNWLVLALVVSIAGCPVALPFWVQLYRPEKQCRKREFRTRLQLAVEALQTVRDWTSRAIDVVADGAYNNESLLTPLQSLGFSLVSRLRVDARLRGDPPARLPGRRGRPPRYGPFLPRLSTWARRRKGWRPTTVEIYRSRVRLLVQSFDAWWPTCGLLIRVVVVRDPRGRRRTSFLSSTDRTLSPEQIIERFARRWSIEQLFADAKQHLGLDSAEVRSPRSVHRHALLALALITWTHVWHYLKYLRRCHKLPSQPRPAAVSLRGKLEKLRSELAKTLIFPVRLRGTRSLRNTQALADLFARALTAA